MEGGRARWKRGENGREKQEERERVHGERSKIRRGKHVCVAKSAVGKKNGAFGGKKQAKLPRGELLRYIEGIMGGGGDAKNFAWVRGCEESRNLVKKSRVGDLNGGARIIGGGRPMQLRCMS